MPQKMSMKRSRSSVGPAIVKSLFSKRPKVATERYVKRLIARNEEIKYAIISNTYSAVQTTGVYALSNTSQGQTGGQHIGDESTIKGLEFRMLVTVADSTNVVRATIVRWKPNIGYVGCSAAAIYKTTTALLNLTSGFLEDGEDMYQVLYDEVIPLAAAGGNPEQVYRLIKRKLNFRCDFLTNTSNCSNNLYLLLTSDSAAATDPQVQFYSQIAFTDA